MICIVKMPCLETILHGNRVSRRWDMARRALKHGFLVLLFLDGDGAHNRGGHVGLVHEITIGVQAPAVPELWIVGKIVEPHYRDSRVFRVKFLVEDARRVRTFRAFADGESGEASGGGECGLS